MQYDGVTPQEHALVVVDIIFPATDKHVKKYSAQSFLMVSPRDLSMGEASLNYRIPVQHISAFQGGNQCCGFKAFSPFCSRWNNA